MRKPSTLVPLAILALLIAIIAFRAMGAGLV